MENRFANGLETLAFTIENIIEFAPDQQNKENSSPIGEKSVQSGKESTINEKVENGQNGIKGTEAAAYSDGMRYGTIKEGENEEYTAINNHKTASIRRYQHVYTNTSYYEANADTLECVKMSVGFHGSAKKIKLNRDVLKKKFENSKVFMKSSNAIPHKIVHRIGSNNGTVRYKNDTGGSFDRDEVMVHYYNNDAYERNSPAYSRNITAYSGRERVKSNLSSVELNEDYVGYKNYSCDYNSDYDEDSESDSDIDEDGLAEFRSRLDDEKGEPLEVSVALCDKYKLLKQKYLDSKKFNSLSIEPPILGEKGYQLYCDRNRMRNSSTYLAPEKDASGIQEPKFLRYQGFGNNINEKNNSHRRKTYPGNYVLDDTGELITPLNNTLSTSGQNSRISNGTKEKSNPLRPMGSEEKIDIHRSQSFYLGKSYTFEAKPLENNEGTGNPNEKTSRKEDYFDQTWTSNKSEMDFTTRYKNTIKNSRNDEMIIVETSRPAYNTVPDSPPIKTTRLLKTNSTGQTFVPTKNDGLYFDAELSHPFDNKYGNEHYSSNGLSFHRGKIAPRVINIYPPKTAGSNSSGPLPKNQKLLAHKRLLMSRNGISHSVGMPGGKKRKRQVELSSRIRSVQPVPKDADGNYILPIQVGILTLLNLGKIVTDRETFHNERYIWPVGYVVQREYGSMIDPEKNVIYTCRIDDGGDGPRFYIESEDMPGKPIIAHTATGAWTTAVKLVNKIRKREHSNSASGPDYFGFSHPTIAKMIQDLEGSQLCKNYVFQRFTEMKDRHVRGVVKKGRGGKPSTFMLARGQEALKKFSKSSKIARDLATKIDKELGESNDNTKDSAVKVSASGD
ncbi:Transforming growth factor beta regulator 1 [Zancudomyces culisetae]|uniref:Transforming growth factor beta regulator 1 n=1 Tax=Zancudomyces culisetae TaxID=1213189 RepID=A0A1R1PPC3_ZANCU|nr:Transforming growth factor beta regulator 1 [Zancudomyces culisetae]|eukprot:OMH82791.1 Transforming growth factor beta regulator 1 [Zancudomyces culisetae]